MVQIQSQKYDLEDQTDIFAKEVRHHVKKLIKTIGNNEDSKPLIGSSGPVAANYIEANQSLGKKDFLMKIKTCRKEAKESVLWLRLLNLNNGESQTVINQKLIQEAPELMMIFSAIMRKSQ